MLLLLTLLASDLPAGEGAAPRMGDLRVVAVSLGDEPPAPRRSPYRLDPNVTGPADGKSDALAITGADCDRIGTAFCTTKPRMIYSTAY